MVQDKLPVPGRPSIWVIIGQGPIALAVCAGGGCLDLFTLLYLFSISLSLGDGPIYTEILSQRAVKSKTINQPTYMYLFTRSYNYLIEINFPLHTRTQDCKGYAV